MDATETFSNVLVLPYTTPWNGGVDHASAPAHARVKHGADFIDRFPDSARQQPAKKVSGTFLYGGPLKIHFGHVICDSIPRLHAFDPSRHQGVVFAPLGNTNRVPEWTHDIFALFGVMPEHVVQATEPTIFELMEFAPPGTVIRRGPHDWYLQHLRRLDLRLTPMRHERIFIGRRHIIGQGSVMGESFFAAMLSRSGFASISPEQHDIYAQASLMASARQVVFTEGSGILATDLLPSLGAEVYMIPRRNGGEALFGPQLTARASCFRLLGGPDNILRLDNHRGMRKPDSPSYLLRPESVHADMVAAGLIEEAFDQERFLGAEREDAIAYWQGDVVAAEAQLGAAALARLDLSH